MRSVPAALTNDPICPTQRWRIGPINALGRLDADADVVNEFPAQISGGGQHADPNRANAKVGSIGLFVIVAPERHATGDNGRDKVQIGMDDEHILGSALDIDFLPDDQTGDCRGHRPTRYNADHFLSERQEGIVIGHTCNDVGTDRQQQERDGQMHQTRMHFLQLNGQSIHTLKVSDDRPDGSLKRPTAKFWL